jgi:hypothetical protein
MRLICCNEPLRGLERGRARELACCSMSDPGVKAGVQLLRLAGTFMLGKCDGDGQEASEEGGAGHHVSRKGRHSQGQGLRGTSTPTVGLFPPVARILPGLRCVRPRVFMDRCSIQTYDLPWNMCFGECCYSLHALHPCAMDWSKHPLTAQETKCVTRLH